MQALSGPGCSVQRQAKLQPSAQVTTWLAWRRPGSETAACYCWRAMQGREIVWTFRVWSPLLSTDTSWLTLTAHNKDRAYEVLGISLPGIWRVFRWKRDHKGKKEAVSCCVWLVLVEKVQDSYSISFCHSWRSCLLSKLLETVGDVLV